MLGDGFLTVPDHVHRTSAQGGPFQGALEENHVVPFVLCQADGARAHEQGALASSTQNRLPCWNWDSTPTRPPIRSAALRTLARPIPVPGYSSAPCRRSNT